MDLELADNIVRALAVKSLAVSADGGYAML